MNETQVNMNNFTETQLQKVQTVFRKIDEHSLKMVDQITEFRDTQLTFKFEIDKLMAISNQHEQKLERLSHESDSLQRETTRLGITKADYSEYSAEIKRQGDLVESAVKQTNETHSQTKNMIDFVYKYEPIYI